MYLTTKSLPRRTVLRGLGATLALPFLDAMTPAMALASQRAKKPAHRFLAFYVPNGMAMEYWSPKGEGSAFGCRRFPGALGVCHSMLGLSASTTNGWRFTRAHPARF